MVCDEPFQGLNVIERREIKRSPFVRWKGDLRVAYVLSFDVDRIPVLSYGMRRGRDDANMAESVMLIEDGTASASAVIAHHEGPVIMKVDRGDAAAGEAVLAC